MLLSYDSLLYIRTANRYWIFIPGILFFLHVSTGPYPIFGLTWLCADWIQTR